MTARIYPADAVAGAPTYTGRALRQTAVSPFVAMGSAARPLGAKSGIRVGTPSTIVTATSSTWTVQPFAGVIDGEAAAIAGPYTYSFDTTQTGSVNAAGGAARVDRLDVQVSDPAESDGSSAPSIQIVYTAGTPGLAAAPARSHALAQINVPATGGGSPTVSWAPSWCGDPGEWTFNTVAERDAYVTAIGSANVPKQQSATVIADTITAKNGVYTWNGTAWVTVAVQRIINQTLVGGTPPANAQFVEQIGFLTVTTNSSGDTSIVYPTAFTNGVVCADLLRYDVGVGDSTMVLNATQATTQLNFRVYQTNGTPLASSPLMVAYKVLGW